MSCSTTTTTTQTIPAHTQRRRPRRPPFLLVESDGVGVTSSIRPMRMPARARARRADCAPGPGVLVPLPPVARILTCRAEMPSSLQRAASLWSAIYRRFRGFEDFARTDVLGSQHGGVRGRLVAVGLDLHAAGDTGDGFAARQISDVDEGVVEGGEDAGNAEDELALLNLLISSPHDRIRDRLASRTWGPSCQMLARCNRLHARWKVPGCSPAHRARPSSWEACWLRVNVRGSVSVVDVCSQEPKANFHKRPLCGRGTTLFRRLALPLRNFLGRVRSSALFLPSPPAMA